jgi:hypothetical protein
MPPHIAQLVAGHRDINITMGYKAVYPEEVINGHRAFITRRRALRPSQEYRTPTDAEWEEFLGHFERRRVALGDCGRAYGTSCIHEHSCFSELTVWSLIVRLLICIPGRVGRDGPSCDVGERGHAELDRLALAAQGRINLGELVLGAGEADPEPLDLAEPALALGLGDAVTQVGADLFQPAALGGVRP